MSSRHLLIPVLLAAGPVHAESDLFTAVARERVEWVAKCLASGTPVGEVDACGWTPLMWACRGKEVDRPFFKDPLADKRDPNAPSTEPLTGASRIFAQIASMSLALLHPQ